MRNAVLILAICVLAGTLVVKGCQENKPAPPTSPPPEQTVKKVVAPEEPIGNAEEDPATHEVTDDLVDNGSGISQEEIEAFVEVEPESSPGVSRARYVPQQKSRARWRLFGRRR